jgi:hypothetical protein
MASSRRIRPCAERSCEPQRALGRDENPKSQALAACFWWNDRQSWDQALVVARSQVIDWEDLRAWAAEEGAPVEVLHRF